MDLTTVGNRNTTASFTTSVSFVPGFVWPEPHSRLMPLVGTLNGCLAEVDFLGEGSSVQELEGVRDAAQRVADAAHTILRHKLYPAPIHHYHDVS
jgi:hypothetical protein